MLSPDLYFKNGRSKLLPKYAFDLAQKLLPSHHSDLRHVLLRRVMLFWYEETYDLVGSARIILEHLFF